MACVIALSNQKGGVGKTTSSVSIAYELSRLGLKTLLIDFDPQASATSGLGLSLRDAGVDLYDMFFKRVQLSKIVTQSPFENLFVAPSSKDLVSLEIEMGKAAGRELILRSELAPLHQVFDYVVIDCPPSSGLLTLNALGASRYILVPLQAEYYALEGVTSLMSTVEFVRHTFNPNLELLGVFMTMTDSRTNLSVQVEKEAREFFKEKMFVTSIPRSIKLSECPSHQKPIGVYDSSSTGAKAYRLLTSEVVERTAQIGKQQGGSADKMVGNG
jgi:chromosome partitioning protein